MKYDTEDRYITGKNVKYKNFSGNAERYFPNGKKHFIIGFDSKVEAYRYEKYGNIHYDEEDNTAFMDISISNAEEEECLPYVAVRTSDDEEYVLTKGLIGILDDLNIIKIDVEINPWYFEYNGKEYKKTFVASPSYPEMPMTVYVSARSDRYEAMVKVYINDLRKKRILKQTVNKKEAVEKTDEIMEALKNRALDLDCGPEELEDIRYCVHKIRRLLDREDN